MLCLGYPAAIFATEGATEYNQARQLELYLGGSRQRLRTLPGRSRELLDQPARLVRGGLELTGEFVEAAGIEPVGLLGLPLPPLRILQRRSTDPRNRIQTWKSSDPTDLLEDGSR